MILAQPFVRSAVSKSLMQTTLGGAGARVARRMQILNLGRREEMKHRTEATVPARRQSVPELEDVGPDQGGEARDQGGDDPRA
jgi:hypothetical protein